MSDLIDKLKFYLMIFEYRFHQIKLTSGYRLRAIVFGHRCVEHTAQSQAGPKCRKPKVGTWKAPWLIAIYTRVGRNKVSQTYGQCKYLRCGGEARQFEFINLWYVQVGPGGGRNRRPLSWGRPTDDPFLNPNALLSSTQEDYSLWDAAINLVDQSYQVIEYKREAIPAQKQKNTLLVLHMPSCKFVACL